MNSSVIIVAAGKGKDLRKKIPKQYVNLIMNLLLIYQLKNSLILKRLNIYYQLLIKNI